MNLSQPASCLFPIKGALGLDSSCHKPLPFDRTRAPSLPHPSPSSQTNTSIAHITMHFLPTAMVARNTTTTTNKDGVVCNTITFAAEDVEY